MILHLVSLLISAASATSFYIQPFPDFVKAAPNVVRGNLHDIIVENGITSDGAKTIFTYATLDIKESIKGSITAPTIRVRKLGGTRDGMTLEVPSSPEFVESEDTVWFLSPPREDQSYEVWGLELGKFWLKEEGGDFVLKGGILDYTPDERGDAHPEAHRTWTLSQLRELAASSDRGTKSAPSPSSVGHDVQSKAAPPQMKEEKQPDAKNSENSAKLLENGTEEPQPRRSPPFWAYGVVLVIALGIFLYFKGRS